MELFFANYFRVPTHGGGLLKSLSSHLPVTSEAAVCARDAVAAAYDDVAAAGRSNASAGQNRWENAAVCVEAVAAVVPSHVREVPAHFQAFPNRLSQHSRTLPPSRNSASRKLKALPALVRILSCLTLPFANPNHSTSLLLFRAFVIRARLKMVIT